MTKRMLIDTTHAEETRVVVLDGNRLDDYDVETSSKKQLKGNIYLAKIVRIEPSLQAAFVEYGGNRHGFLAFSEIHPDYYQIPVADRERLIALQEEEARAEEARADREDDEAENEADAAPQGAEARNGSSSGSSRNQRGGRRDNNRRDSGRRSGSNAAAAAPDEAASTDTDRLLDQDAGPDAGIDIGADTHPDVPVSQDALPESAEASQDVSDATEASDAERPEEEHQEEERGGTARPVIEMPLEIEADTVVADSDNDPESDSDSNSGSVGDGGSGSDEEDDAGEESDGTYAPAPETISGESADDGHAQRRTARFLRQYKIQEVMRRRQIILVQVVKEERGNKGAALTTYISLAGRFSVLMPNSPRGGGVSRKITSAADRRRLKEITQELEIPRGMGMIVRTAGAQRPRAEIRRDGEYLLRTWDEIRETTLGSTAPCLVYEEASLIKRAIRDVYTRDVEEIVVDGEPGWKSAREFMRTLMPSNVNKVGLWRESGQTLFGHHGVEHHLDAMLQPTVQLRSGGYLVINQTEALVAIDVNSGRSTRERGIEETAFRTNMEAADEVARQLRLRDLAGLIVIDFIDMEVRRNNATVERRLKDALSNDRARIQVGSISHFGLLEMSRQRLRPSIAESSFVTCPHCAGTGFVRGTESSALHVLRAIEEEAGKRKASEILVYVASPVALYVLNHKRAWLGEIETRYGLTVHLAADDSLLPPNLRIDRIRPYLAPAAPEAALQAAPSQSNQRAATATAAVTAVPIAAAAPPSFDPFETDDETGNKTGNETGSTEPRADVASITTDSEAGAGETDENRRRKRRRRRRGGRRENGSEGGAETADDSVSDAEAGFAEDADETATSGTVLPTEAATGTDQPAATVADAGTGEGSDAARSDGQGAEGASRGRRRRGGRNRNRNAEAGAQSGYERNGDDRSETVEADTSRPAPRAYNGPTPADPFAGSFDIFEMIERDAEEMSAVMSPTAASAASHQPAVPVASAAETVAQTTAAADALPDDGATAPVEQAAELPAEPVTDATVQPAEAEAASVTDVEQADTAPAAGPKPRKPRASRARKTADATVQAAVAEVEQPAVTAEPATDAVEPAAAPAKPRRKPAARARKAIPAVDATDAAAPAAVATAAEPDAPEAAAADTVAPAPVSVPATVPATAATEPAAATTGADPSIVQPQVIGDSAPPAARRTGWWKR